MTTIADAAITYARRGWKPVPLHRKTKKPIGKGWQTRPFDPTQFNGNAINIAVQLGAASGGLVDVDLDNQLAIGFAPEFLPATAAIFGRRSKPAAHQLYVSDLCQSEKAATIQYKDGNAVIVELRIGAGNKGAATTMPPSMHPSGELVQWVHDGEPARVAGDDLKRAVLQLAVACLLKPRYPGAGSRHEAALVLGGVLARADWLPDDIGHLVTMLARAVDDDEWQDRVGAAIGAVVARANGGDVPGLPRLAEVWGKDVADTLGKWASSRFRAPARAPASRMRLRSSLPHSTPRICATWRSRHSGCAGPARVGNPRTRSLPSISRALCADRPATAAPRRWPPS
jgi:hypothetical protein